MRGIRAAAPAIAVALAVASTAMSARAHVGSDELLAEARVEVAAHPADPAARRQLAGALRLHHDWDGALAALAAAEDRGADADEIAATRAAVLLDAGRAAAALDELDRLLARRPDAPAAHFDRGRACLALGRADEGARELGIAIATLPAPRPEQVLLHRDALLAAHRPADAVRALDAGMARVGAIAALQLPAVELEVALARVDAALARLDVLMAREGRNPAWVVRRAEILADAGRAAEARATYEDARAIIAAHAANRRIHAFDPLSERIAAALASAPAARTEEIFATGGNDTCGLQSDAAWP